MEQTNTAPEMTELEELESTYCDMHKDVYGVKARWYRAESVEQARADIKSLEEALEAYTKQERRNQQQAAERFEKRLEEIIKMGAGTRENAIKWIHQAENTDGDDEFLCYQLGLRYGYFKKAV
jgi:hypothetical protein